jgi:hypothetical protein
MTLNKLISRIARKIDPPPPPPPPPPIDMDGVMGGIYLMIAAFHHGHKRPDESVLTAYARACHYRDEAELLHVALNDGLEFERRHIEHTVKSRDPHIIGVERSYVPKLRRGVIERVLEEESVHQVIDVLFPWWDSRPGLSPVRPCRPADAEPAEVGDEVLSDIGRSLLALAKRERERAEREA